MSDTHVRPTTSDYDEKTLVSDKCFYLTKLLAKIIRNMDFKHFTLETTPENYIKDVINLAFNFPGFAQAYREWCKNFRHRKDFYWKYEVETGFNDYQ
jgi:hypothetical protein